MKARGFLDLVRHVGGQPTDRGQAIRLSHALFHLLDVGEILAHADETGHLAGPRAKRPEGYSDRNLLAITPAQPEP